MAGAAVADAQYKDKRREDLDKRLDEARSRFRRLQLISGEIDETQLPSEEEIPQGNRSRPVWDPERSLRDPPTRQPILLDTIAGICVLPETLTKWQARYNQRTYLRDLIHNNTGIPRYWGSKLDTTIDLDRLGSQIDRSEKGNVVVQREPKTPKQFAMLTLSISRLVDELTQEAVNVSHPDNPEAAKRAYESLDGSRIKLKFLRSDGYPIYQHPDHDPTTTYETRRELSRLTRLIFASWQETVEKAALSNGQLSRFGCSTIQPFWYQSMVHKICHNLLVSPIAPGVHNYNTMINGFTRIGQHSLAQVVVDHYVRSYVRPTRQSHVCVLHHYREKQDIVQFYGVLRRLVGLSEHGTKEKRRTSVQVLADPALRIWAKSVDVAAVGEYVVERSRLDRRVVEAIIQGLLSFDRVWDATRVFLGATEDKIIVGGYVFARLIEQILDSLDRDAAQAMLCQGLMRHVDFYEHVLKSRSAATSLVRWRVYLLFDLAGTQPWAPSTHALSAEESDPNNRRLVVAMFTADATAYVAYLFKLIIPSIKKYLVSHHSCVIDSPWDTFYDTPEASSEESPWGTLADGPVDPLDTRLRTISGDLPDILAALDCCKPPSLDRGRLVYYHAGEQYSVFQRAGDIESAASWAKEELIHILTDEFDHDTVIKLHDANVDAMERVQQSIDLWKQRQAEGGGGVVDIPVEEEADVRSIPSSISMADILRRQRMV